MEPHDKNITINVTVEKGGLLNLAKDNGNISSIQNNVEDEEKIVSEIVQALQVTSYQTNVIEKSEDEKVVTDEDMKSFPNKQIEFFKNQLGNRLNGTESKLEILTMFLQEIDTTLQSDKRFDCLPVFIEIPRKVVKAYLYIDNTIMPFDEVEITEYYMDSIEKYYIENKYYYIYLVLQQGTISYMEMGYTINFPDVNERLLGLSRAKKVVTSKNLKVHIIEENKDVSFSTEMLKEKSQGQLELTDYWIEQMQKITEIENYYGIKFHLPKYADVDNYISIDIIYDSIKKNSCSTFPPIPMEKPFLQRYLDIDKEYEIGNGETFDEIKLFGYEFIPVAVYFMICKLIYKKKISAWETELGGVPVRVEFFCHKY